MKNKAILLGDIFQGWEGYNRSIALPLEGLTREQLSWRPATGMRSLGESISHISFGRLEWFSRMNAPGSDLLAKRVDHWWVDDDGVRHIDEKRIEIADDAGELATWLDSTWKMIEKTLNTWDVADLEKTYKHKWNGEYYSVSRQWTIWRIMSHDMHHGGQIAQMLALQDIDAFELRDLGGHITELPHWR